MATWLAETCRNLLHILTSFFVFMCICWYHYCMCSNNARIVDHINLTSSYLWLCMQLIGLNAVYLVITERDAFKCTVPGNLMSGK